ncbi:MAG: hypothetical protein AAF198_04525 [Pseudomonadota bacterium]
MSEQTEDVYLPAKIIYGLYGAGFIIGLTAIAGVIFAYISRGKNDVHDTHLDYQIQTFWVGLVAIVIGIALSFIGIGFLILLAWFIWAVLRIVSGLILVLDNKPITEVKYLSSFAT